MQIRSIPKNRSLLLPITAVWENGPHLESAAVLNQFLFVRNMWAHLDLLIPILKDSFPYKLSSSSSVSAPMLRSTTIEAIITSTGVCLSVLTSFFNLYPEANYFRCGLMSFFGTTVGPSNDSCFDVHEGWYSKKLLIQAEKRNPSLCLNIPVWVNIIVDPDSHWNLLDSTTRCSSATIGWYFKVHVNVTSESMEGIIYWVQCIDKIWMHETLHQSWNRT